MKRLRFLQPFALLALVSVFGAAPVVAQDDTMQEEVSVELVIASAVEDREPVGASDTFSADVGQVFAWLRVTGASDQALQVVWTHGPHESTVPLEIGGSPWRTWSSKQIPSDWTGEWTVEVQDADGNVLQSTTFTVQADAS